MRYKQKNGQTRSLIVLKDSPVLVSHDSGLKERSMEDEIAKLYIKASRVHHSEIKTMKFDDSSQSDTRSAS